MTDVWDDIAKAFEVAAEIIQPEQTPDWTPLPHQVPPDLPWFAWILMGGRGSGKTAAAAKYTFDHIMGPPCLPHVPGGHWISIVAPTLGDAVTSCVNGPSGLRKWDPNLRVVNEVGGAIVKFSNGATSKLFGAHKPEDIERFRAGGNRCFAWLEEMAAWRYLEEAWQQIRYGLRLGPRPHCVVSTTPKPRLVIKNLMNDPKNKVTHGVTADNPYLDSGVKDALYEDYGGTRMGRQELLGEYLEDVPGALWKPEYIEPYRITIQDMPDYLDRIVVGVDPQLKDQEKSDETGIVVAGMVSRWARPNVLFPELPHAFILSDETLQGTPRKWGRRVVETFSRFDCNRVVAEINNGGDMVMHTLHTIESSLPVKTVHATRGKAKRAEPIVQLYEQGRIHHVGTFGKLEDQMLTWDADDPDMNDFSPDRMDALVWALWELMVGRGLVRRNRMKDQRLVGRR